jgi:hypothetical protein
MDFEFKQTYRNEPSENFIEDVKAVAKKLDRPTVTMQQYRPHGKYHPATIQRRFGSWLTVLEHAGLLPTRSPFNISDEQLFANLYQLWSQLGRQPRSTDTHTALSKYSAITYARRFGSWQKALKVFVTTHQKAITAPLPKGNAKNQRIPSSAMRFNVLLRDGFKCTHCGHSPLTHPGTTLHCDHIVPFSLGGKTIMANLQTLCATCNLSKGSAG